MKLITARAVREKLVSIARKDGPPRVPSDMWLRRQIDRGNLPAHDTLISGIRYWREETVDAAIERLIANPQRKPGPPARSVAPTPDKIIEGKRYWRESVINRALGLDTPES